LWPKGSRVILSDPAIEEALGRHRAAMADKVRSDSASLGGGSGAQGGK